jgi:hypothetical protein
MARGNICIGSGASRGGFSSPFLPNDVEFAQDCFYVDAVYGIYENNDKYSHEIRGFSARYYMLPQGGVNTGNSNVINRVVPVFTPIGGRIGEVSIGLYGTGFYCAGTVMEVYGIE